MNILHKKDALLAMTIAFTLFSCGRDVDESCILEDTPQNLRLRFEGKRADFGIATRAVTEDEWANQARIYLSFDVNGQHIGTYADYDVETGLWNMETSKSTILLTLEGGECEAYYFEAPSLQTTQRVNLDMNSIAYGDEHAAYEVDAAEALITVRGTLAPLTARLRMQGTPGRNFVIAGLSRYTAYNAAANNFTAATSKLTGTIGNDGLSEPFYVLLADNETRTLTLEAEGVAAWTRAFDESTIRPAAAGRITLPTTAEPLSWRLINTVNGRDITLPVLANDIVVEPGSRTARLSGEVADQGNGTILARGFLLAEASNMTNARDLACKEGTFAYAITDPLLRAETRYYVRAYARNERGTAYSPTNSFLTTPEGIILIDGFADDEIWDNIQVAQGDIDCVTFGDDENWDATDVTQGDLTLDAFGDDEDWN